MVASFLALQERAKGIRDKMKKEKDKFLDGSVDTELWFGRRLNEFLNKAKATLEETCSKLNGLKELFLQHLEKTNAKFLVPL